MKAPPSPASPVLPPQAGEDKGAASFLPHFMGEMSAKRTEGVVYG